MRGIDSFKNCTNRQTHKMISASAERQIALLHATLSTVAAAKKFFLWVQSVVLSCFWLTGVSDAGFPAISYNIIFRSR